MPDISIKPVQMIYTPFFLIVLALSCPGLHAASPMPELIADINLNPVSASPNKLTPLGRKLFFSASNFAGSEIWVFDLDTGESSILADITPGSFSTIIPVILTVNNKVYFEARSDRWWHDPRTGMVDKVQIQHDRGRYSKPGQPVTCRWEIVFRGR
jgi:ELWxxDGT repeat protein